MVTKENDTYSFTFTQSKLDKRYWQSTHNDNREIVSPISLSTLPYKAIGLLKITYSLNIVSYRTGILINPNIVLTAGHNLYDHRKNPNNPSIPLAKAIDISFYSALNNNKSQYRECKFKSYQFPVDFEFDSKEDFGIIILQERIGESTGWVDLKVFEDKSSTDKETNYYISGYPLNKTNKSNDIFYQYEAKGKILDVNKQKGIITTNIKSSYGQSGSGLCYFDLKDNKWYVVGVHFASSVSDNEFYSTMITQKRYDLIEKWIKESQLK